MYSDTDISNGVQLASGTGTVVIGGGTGANDLSLTTLFGSMSATVPLVISGNLARLPAGGYTFGTTTVLDVLLLSDGNNMALAYVAQNQAKAISFVVSAWQRNPTFADARDAVGRWGWTAAYANANLRDLNGSGFHQETLAAGDIVGSAGAYAMVDSTHGLNVPLTIGQGRASLLSAPAPAGTGLWQVLNMTYDSTGSAAGFFVGTELDDPGDVSITIGLLSAQPVAVQPQDGLWVIDAEDNGQSGRGFQVETHNGTTVLTYYGYRAGGHDHWYLAAGALASGSFSAGMTQYQGGTALGATYSPATANGSAGTVTMNFTSTTAGTITLPGESAKSISKFPFSGSGNPVVLPSNGLWVIDAENNGQSGRGFQIEQNAGLLVFTYYGYDAGGQETWYLAAGQMSGNTFTAP